MLLHAPTQSYKRLKIKNRQNDRSGNSSVKRRNFRKANCSHYNALINKLAKSLLPPDLRNVDLVYQEFYKVIKTTAKNSIPRGRQNNHIPCWDAE